MAFQAVTMSAPYAGLDLISPIDNMDPSKALELTNFFCGATAPSVRAGYKQFITTGATITGEIKFLHRLPLADGTTVLIVGTDTKLYQVTSGGVATDITKTVPHTNGEFTWAILGNYIYLCNASGAAGNEAMVYTGTGTFIDTTFTGVTLYNLVSVASFKRRLIFVEKGTENIWYTQSTDVTGATGSPALKKEELGFNLTQGGYILWTGSYTNQTASTAAEYFYAISSEGEIIMYSGDAPNAANWTQVARFYIGKPLGYRSFVRVNQDTWIITNQGIVPLSALFENSPEVAVNMVSGSVNSIISDAAKSMPFDHGWYGFFWSQGRKVYISVPTSGVGGYFLVYSMDTQGWSKIQLSSDSHNASSTIFNTLPFYGGSDGKIWQGETGLVDAYTTTGTGDPINFSYRGPFSFYGTRGNFKVWRDIRPILKTGANLSFSLGLDINFEQTPNDTVITTGSGTFTPWGTTGAVVGGTGYVPWGSPWSDDTKYVFDRYATKGQGHCASIKMSGSLKNTTLQLLGFEVRYEVGGQV